MKAIWPSMPGQVLSSRDYSADGRERWELQMRHYIGDCRFGSLGNQQIWGRETWQNRVHPQSPARYSGVTLPAEFPPGPFL